jgi:hypothetical protein
MVLPRRPTWCYGELPQAWRGLELEVAQVLHHQRVNLNTQTENGQAR